MTFSYLTGQIIAYSKNNRNGVQQAPKLAYILDKENLKIVFLETYCRETLLSSLGSTLEYYKPIIEFINPGYHLEVEITVERPENRIWAMYLQNTFRNYFSGLSYQKNKYTLLISSDKFNNIFLSLLLFLLIYLPEDIEKLDNSSLIIEKILTDSRVINKYAYNNYKNCYSDLVYTSYGLYCQERSKYFTLYNDFDLKGISEFMERYSLTYVGDFIRFMKIFKVTSSQVITNIPFLRSWGKIIKFREVEEI